MKGWIFSPRKRALRARSPAPAKLASRKATTTSKNASRRHLVSSRWAARWAVQPDRHAAANAASAAIEAATALRVVADTSQTLAATGIFDNGPRRRARRAVRASPHDGLLLTASNLSSRVTSPRSVRPRPCHSAACPASTACADLPMSGRSQGDYSLSTSTSQASHRISRMGLESRSRPGRPQRSHVSSLRCCKGSTRLSNALSSSLVQEPGPGQGRGPAGVLAAW